MCSRFVAALIPMNGMKLFNCGPSLLDSWMEGSNSDQWNGVGRSLSAALPES